MSIFGTAEEGDVGAVQEGAGLEAIWALQVSHSLVYYGEGAILVVVAFVLVIIASGVVFFCRTHVKSKVEEVKELVGVGSTKPRFRKRDKVLFYGRKMLRKVKSISGQVTKGPPGKKKKLVLRLARRLLQLKRDTMPPQLQVLEPPAEYLQEDVTQKVDQRLPSEVLYMLKSIRVFGQFEQPLFLELCKHMETITIPAGEYLFTIGAPDDNFYVVQSGCLNVFITEVDGSVITLKVVKAGDNIASLLSFTDVLTGHPHPFRTVSAQAMEDSVVLRLPVAAFQEVFEQHPETFVRVIQIIMVRLQRVTFTALHHYLGLSSEMFNLGVQRKKSVPYIAMSPTKKPRENLFFKEPHTISESQFEKFNKPPDSPEHSTDTAEFASGDRVRYEPSAPGKVSSPAQGTTEAARRKRSETVNPFLDDEVAMMQVATEGFKNQLGLPDDALLRGKVVIRDVPQGTYLMKKDSHKDAALILVLNGSLSLSQRVPDIDEEILMFNAHPGEIVGALAVLTGEPSFFSIRARSASKVAMLTKTTFYSIMAEKPKIVLHVAHSVVKRLSPFVRQIDFALDWVFLESGMPLYKQVQESDCTYIVLCGRLRSVITHSNGKKELVAEYGRGDLVGIVETLTQTPRSTTVMAVRDSELAKLPDGLLSAIKLKYPMVVTTLINLLGRRILGSWQKPSSLHMPIETRPTRMNFSTVALVSVTDDVPLSAFTYELFHSLSAIGDSLRLTSDFIQKTLGSTIMDPANEFRLSSWLAQQEDQHTIVLYQCDPGFSPWSQRCIRQADCILIVALADKEPSVGKVEKQLEHLAVRTQKELVLLHREGADRPQGTVAWLNIRSWCSSHHHIQCSKRMFAKRSQNRINEQYSKILMTEPNVHSDFSRLARWLTGTSVGLVLGGGGARGAAHVGMIKAILEAGIPIDMVGGVSIGAFMGALWCMEKNITTVTQKAREWSMKMTQLWRQVIDLTYPITAMFSGAGFNKLIKDTFIETQIEDLWLPYFTLTTDISSSSMRIHTHGSLWRYCRASMSLSGYMPPLCDPADGHLLLDGGYVNNLPGTAWRYVRASMSIAGVLPPMCDPVDGHLLVDGCYINNVPADVMLQRGVKHILAIDVGSQDDTDLTNYGDSLSGWWLLWKRWNPFAAPVKVPNLPDIQSRLAYVSCVRQLEEVKNCDYCEYIRPPIDKYKTLQFGSFDEIKDVGYVHGKTYFEALKKGGALSSITSMSHRSRKQWQRSCQQPPTTPYTFTDLAQMVCKVPNYPNRYMDEVLDINGEELTCHELVAEKERDVLVANSLLRFALLLPADHGATSTSIINVQHYSEDEYEADEEDQEAGYVSEPSAELMEGAFKVGESSPVRRRWRRPGSLSYSENELESDLEFLRS